MNKALLVASLFIMAFLPGAKAQLLTPQVDSIPMSDGRKLAADIYKPAGMATGPVILIQTPYNRVLYRVGLPLLVAKNINSSNYIFVIVDWRGFYGSASAAYAGAPDMGTDGYSCVEWIAQQSWSNGKVGTWGPSALGKVQFQTAKKNPPHLTCICPLVAGPQFDYEEYFPNGALRTEYVEQLNSLGFGFKNTVMAHPTHDATWTFVENTNFYPDSIQVPCFMIGGWYDHNIEVMLPFFSGIQTQSPASVRGKHRLMMGPWVHGGHGTAQVGSTLQGQLSYANAADVDDSAAVAFFDYYLRGISNGWDVTPAIKYYQMGENNWQSIATWPPATSPVDFYLHKDGTLSNTQPANNNDSLSFNYDPNNPSPTVGGPTLRNDLDQGPYDQGPVVEMRNDILTFTTPAFTNAVMLKGAATLHLKVSSNRLDTDFDVRLTDVYPDGRSMLVNDGVMRMRFRNGNTAADTSLMIPGQIYDCNITLPNTAITFLAGHKLRIDVTSSNYPRFNRNMNTGGPMYPGNSTDSLVNPLIATNTVYTNATSKSYITLPLAGYIAPNGIAADDNNKVTIYPNPTTAQVTVNCNDGHYYHVGIFTLTGEKVIDGQLQGSNTFDIKDLPGGIYFIELTTRNNVAYRYKLIKQ